VTAAPGRAQPRDQHGFQRGDPPGREGRLLSHATAAYPNLIHYNRLPKGGHFAAWEQPQLLSAELRETFRTLR
jgi:pimeloyl-ACP methyl ester carboxylesterase